MLDNQTGLVRYNPDDNFTGFDNFTYRVTDNYSAISNEGVVFIDVTEGGVAPEPAYNVDNFTVTVDNSSTITTTWDLFTGLGGQAPGGFLILCSESDNLTVPTDNFSYAEDNQCADGTGPLMWAQARHNSPGLDWIRARLTISLFILLLIVALTSTTSNPKL